MKLFIATVIFGTLAFLATAQDDDSSCTADLEIAANNLRKFCAPVFMHYMSEQQGQRGPPESRRRRRQAKPSNEEIEEKVEICLTKIKEEDAFADIVSKCPDGEDQFGCITEKYFEVCPPKCQKGKDGSRRGKPSK